MLRFCTCQHQGQYWTMVMRFLNETSWVLILLISDSRELHMLHDKWPPVIFLQYLLLEITHLSNFMVFGFQHFSTFDCKDVHHSTTNSGLLTDTNQQGFKPDKADVYKKNIVWNPVKPKQYINPLILLFILRFKISFSDASRVI